MPTFYHKTERKTVKAYSLDRCPEPKEDWVKEKPDYQEVDQQLEESQSTKVAPSQNLKAPVKSTTIKAQPKEEKVNDN